MIPSLPRHRLPRLFLGLYTVISRLVIQGCQEGPQEVPVSSPLPHTLLVAAMLGPRSLSRGLCLWHSIPPVSGLRICTGVVVPVNASLPFFLP